MGVGIHVISEGIFVNLCSILIFFKFLEHPKNLNFFIKNKQVIFPN